MTAQVKNRKRVVDHGEVFTSNREVNAMLDLVENETQRIDSRFLEPACRNGNFLAEILNRKLNVIVNKYKIFISKASPNGDDYPHQVITKPRLGEKNSCCTETYLVAGLYDDKKTAENVISYTYTCFFRFMMTLVKSTQNISQKVYYFVPMQDFSKKWTDEELYKKYNLTQNEIEYIESMIKPMEVSSE